MRKWDENFYRNRFGDDYTYYYQPDANEFEYVSDTEQSELCIEQVDVDEIIEDYAQEAVGVDDVHEMRELISQLVDEIYSAITNDILLDDIQDKVDRLYLNR